MATWTQPRIAHVHDNWTYTWYNAEVRDSLQALHDGLVYWVGTVHQESTIQVQPTANQAVLQAFVVRFPCTVSGIGYAVDTVGTHNGDFGLYDGAGTRLRSSGSAALAGTGVRRSTFTAYTLSPFTLYYWAYAFAGTSPRLLGGNGPAIGLLSRVVASSFPLPSSLTIGTTPRTEAAALAGVVD